MRTAVFFCFAVSLSTTAIAAPVPKDPPKNEKLLIGVWHMTFSETPRPEGVRAIVEFTADGKIELRVEFAGQNVVRKGTYKVEGDKIHYTLSTDTGERKETLVIKSIAEKEILVEDPKGKRETLERLPKK